MPKTKPKPPSRSRDDDSDDEPMTQTQSGSLTQAERAISALKPDEITRKVNDLVQFFLIMDQKKVPIKRQDINKHVLKEHSRAFLTFIPKAAKKLKSVFGIDLVEISSKQKSYILVNSIETDAENPHLEWSAEDHTKMGLVMVILATIFMSGNIIDEDKLFSMLKRLGLDTDSTVPHDTFGDVKKFICGDLVKQGYLLYERQGHTDPPAYDFKWGPRAFKETSKQNAIDFFCQICSEEGREEDPKQWTSQWQEVEKEKEEPV